MATLDETSYTGSHMDDHPINWYHEHDDGRPWYAGGGHTLGSHSEPEFMDRPMRSIAYTTGSARFADADTDGVSDASDNCIDTANAD